MFETGTATDYADLLDRLHTFLTAKGSAFGLTYEGTGDGTFTDYSGGASSIAETFTITATSPTVFDVVGSISGDIGDATVGTPFAHAKLEFTITAGGTAFVATDEFVLSTAPKWTSRRKALGCRVTATQGNTGLYGAQNIVDGKVGPVTTEYWRIGDPVTVPQDVELEFFEAETIAEYQLAQFTTTFYNYGPAAWTFQYWDGDSWEDLDSESGHDDWTASGWKSFVVDSPVSATRYRLRITALNGGGTWLQLGAVRMLRSDGVDAAFSQTIWEAPGNDGLSEILVGAHLFERQDADYFNMELAAFDGFSASELWREQAGAQAGIFVPLWDTSIPYWFVCDGRRVALVVKLSTQYEAGYLGLLEPYFTPDQWPYPIAIGGSMAFGLPTPGWSLTSWRWSNTDHEHRIFTHSDPGGITSLDPEDHQMIARDLSGAWFGFAGRVNDGIVNLVGDMKPIWPTALGLTELDPNLDGSYQTFPIMLISHTPNTFGQLGGVRIVSGQGLTAETLITEGSIDWIAINDVYRTDRDDFLAIALD